MTRNHMEPHTMDKPKGPDMEKVITIRIINSTEDILEHIPTGIFTRSTQAMVDMAVTVVMGVTVDMGTTSGNITTSVSQIMTATPYINVHI